MAQAGSAASGQFVTQQQAGQWLTSKLIGTTVVSANNESIGDVNDVLMDRNGQAAAVIVGVGGFLGIGEKDVAVAFQQLEFTSRAANANGNASTAATTGSRSATASSSASATSSGGKTATASATDNGVPDRIVLRMTKQDLQNAPGFARADRRDAAASSAGTSSSSSTSRAASDRGTGGPGTPAPGGGDRGTSGSAPAAPGGSNAAPK